MSAFPKYGFRTQRAIGGILTTKWYFDHKIPKCSTNLVDHVQAVRSAYEAANIPDSFVGRWRQGRERKTKTIAAEAEDRGRKTKKNNSDGKEKHEKRKT
jgi:hypothetical protein